MRTSDAHRFFFCQVRTIVVCLEEIKFVLCFLFPCFQELFKVNVVVYLSKVLHKAEKSCPNKFHKNVEKCEQKIFGKVAGFKTATFLKVRCLFLYRYFVLEVCLNFYGLVNAAHGDKSFEVGFNFFLFFFITSEHTESIFSIFLSGKINDMINTVSVIFNLSFQISEDILFSTYICLEALFNQT